MAGKVAINGLGRIGGAALKLTLEQPQRRLSRRRQAEIFPVTPATLMR